MQNRRDFQCLDSRANTCEEGSQRILHDYTGIDMQRMGGTNLILFT